MSASNPWLRLKAGYHLDDEFVDLSPLAELLFLRALSDCKARRFPGTVSTKTVTRLCADMGQPSHPLAAELVTEGLWELDGDAGYRVAGWEKWQTDPAESKANGRRGGLKSAHKKGLHSARPNPGCELCAAIDLPTESGVPPYVPPTKGGLDGSSYTLQQNENENETENENEMGALVLGESHRPEGDGDPTTNNRHPETDRLCQMLASELHAAGCVDRPLRWEPWRKDMDLLLRRGPTEWATAQPVDPEHVAAMIRFVAGSSWWGKSGNVRSAAKLRKHWETLRAERNQAINGGRVSFAEKQRASSHAAIWGDDGAAVTAAFDSMAGRELNP